MYNKYNNKQKEGIRIKINVDKQLKNSIINT